MKKNTDSLFLCLNAEGGKAPEKIQLLPAGEFILGRDGRRWTKKDAETIAKKSNEYLPHHPIDENHAIDLKAFRGEPAPAMGWFSKIYAETDASIWANVEWTTRGKEALENKEYRYISPVFETSDSGEIVKIMRAGLTNSPNLELPNLNNEETKKKSEPTDNLVKEKNIMNKELCVALGLPESATENEVVAAISKLKTQANSTNVDISAYAPRADLNQMETRAVEAEKKLAELNAESLKAKATVAVEKAISDRKIAPASKDVYLEICSSETGFAQFQKAMNATPPIISADQSGATGTPPESSKTTELNAEEMEVCKAAGYTVEEYKKLKGEAK